MSDALPVEPSAPPSAPPSAIVIQDEGLADEYGRQLAVASRNGVELGRLTYAAWPHYMVTFDLQLSDDAPADTEVRILEALLERYPDRRPERLTHTGATSLETLRWFAESHLADGVVVCGSFGTRALYYDPIDTLDLSELPEVLHELAPAVNCTVMYIESVRDYGDIATATLADVFGWMTGGDVFWRFAALRRLAVTPAVPPHIRSAALHLALLNENSGVRQFAAIHLGGFFPELKIRPDHGHLANMLGDPFRALEPFGEPVPKDVPGWNPLQARRNGRYAVAWALGNVCWTATGWGTGHEIEDAEQIRSLLAEQATRFTPARDAWLYDRVLAEFRDEDDGRFGLGVAEPIELYDFLRFVILRWHVVGRLGQRSHDKFYWLVQTTEGICGPPPNPKDPGSWVPVTPTARQLYARPPSNALPDVTEMPPWLFGENYYEASMQLSEVETLDPGMFTR